MTPELQEEAQVATVARAIKLAQCIGREGPFGGYDYGHNGETVEGGRYVVRDFRDPRSLDWGKWLYQTDDAAVHERVYQEMTEHHVAAAAIAALAPIIARLVAEEREACTAVPEAEAASLRAMILATGDTDKRHGALLWSDKIAAAIRARGEGRE